MFSISKGIDQYNIPVKFVWGCLRPKISILGTHAAENNIKWKVVRIFSLHSSLPSCISARDQSSGR